MSAIANRQPDMETVEQSALSYASMGFDVFPIVYREKKPLTKNGFKDASTSADTISNWFLEWPDANIGIAIPKGLIVVDIDKPEVFEDLKEQNLSLPTTCSAKTGRGFHYWYRVDELSIKNAVGIFPGVDIKTAGGYVVAPPSVHSNGKFYEWEVPLSQDFISPAPDWLVEKLTATERSPRPERSRSPGNQFMGIPEGHRDEELFKLACKLRHVDVPREVAEEVVKNVANRCQPPFPKGDALAKVSSAYERYPAGPEKPFVSFVSSEVESFKPVMPLPPLLPQVPELPQDILPDVLRPWLVDISHRFQVDLAFAAAVAFVSLGAVVGRQFGISPKAKDNWLVIPNLWGAIVGRPAQMKSPTLFEVLKPAKHLSEMLIEQSTDSSEEEDSGKDKKGKPPERRLIVNDATTEKLGELLSVNSNGLLLVRDELSGFLQSLERRDRKGDREFYLEAWNGNNPYTVDRIMRGTTHIPALCLSIVGGIQPAKLDHFVSETVRGGSAADGLLQRFQLLVWPGERQVWEFVDEHPDLKAYEQAMQAFEQLSELSSYYRDEIRILRFAPEAQQLFNEWLIDLEKKVRSPEMSRTPTFEGHLAKYRSLMPTLALLFHLIDQTDREAPVSLTAARRAASWCDFLEFHARKVYVPELQPNMLAAHALAAKIKQSSVHDGMPLRDIYRSGWKQLNNLDDVIAGLDVLETLGWARSGIIKTSGRPSQVIHINPKAIGDKL